MKQRIIIYTTIFILWYVWYYYLFQAWKNTYIDTTNLESRELLSEDELSNLIEEADLNSQIISEEQKEKDYSTELENINKLQSKIEKLSWKITYLENPKEIEKLWFFKETYEDIRDDSIISSYFEKDSTYYLLWNIDLDNKKAEIIMLDTAAFYSRPDLLYFISYEWKYYFIPSISKTDFISKDKDLNLQLIEYSKKYTNENVIFFEEEKFLNILKNDYLLKENIYFSRDWKNYNLKLVDRTSNIFDGRNLEKIDFLSKQESKDFYIEKSGDKMWNTDKIIDNLQMSWEEYEKIDEKLRDESSKQLRKNDFFQSDAIFLKMPDNTTALYNLEISFEEDKKFVDSWWYEYTRKAIDILSNFWEEKEIKNYSYKETTSCWVKNWTYMYIPDWEYKYGYHRVWLIEWLDYKEAQKLPESELIYNYDNSDLSVYWKTKTWEDIYFFKDKNDDFLKAMYKYWYYAQLDDYGCLNDNLEFDPQQIECNPDTFLTYDKFIETLPVFFWKDPFGRNVMFLSWNVNQPDACWAKPVIYLYPEEKTDISVTLDWDKKILTSIPEYTNSWEVTSDEQSNIYDKKSSKIYPYLFWEDLMSYKTPEKWFVVKKEEVSNFLDEKLSFVWLNEKEISDFKEYWIPYMQEDNYYFITFLQTKELNKIVPITINPKPDNIFRIFMDFEWIDNYREVEELKLEKFDRTWFSVVEWWGKKK